MRVVEVGQALAGPLAGAILADMGAEVVKVEKPDGGDDARGWGPPWGPSLGGGGDTSLYFHGQNRNKLGVTLDLKSAGDVEALHGLCETADILIQNLRPGVVEELGFGPDAMLERHPRLIYCSIWAFGYEGPMRLAPGFDPLLQAYGGMMSLTGRPEDPPTFCGASINDKATGMFCVIGALAALRQRDRTGRGCLVDTSLFETAVHWVEGPLNAYLVDGRVPKRHGTGGAVIVPYQVFETADRPLCLAAGNDRLWARCAAVLGHPEWGTEARFATGPQRVRNKGELIPLIQAITEGADAGALARRAGRGGGAERAGQRHRRAGGDGATRGGRHPAGAAGGRAARGGAADLLRPAAPAFRAPRAALGRAQRAGAGPSVASGERGPWLRAAPTTSATWWRSSCRGSAFPPASASSPSTTSRCSTASGGATRSAT